MYQQDINNLEKAKLNYKNGNYSDALAQIDPLMKKFEQ